MDEEIKFLQDKIKNIISCEGSVSMHKRDRILIKIAIYETLSYVGYLSAKKEGRL